MLARNGAEALRNLTTTSGCEVLVLDIGLPDSDGRDACQALRAEGQYAPMLFLTALDAVHDRVSGFHAGGDDYVSKPFAIAEVLVRLGALVKRGRPLPEAVSGLRLDPERYSVRHEERQQQLTPIEFRMLAAIAGEPGVIVRRRAVVAAGWPDGAMVSENTIDSYLRRIRVKLEEPTSTDSRRIVRSTALISAGAMTAIIGTVVLALSAVTRNSVDSTRDDRFGVISSAVASSSEGPTTAIKTPVDAMDDSTWL